MRRQCHWAACIQAHAERLRCIVAPLPTLTFTAYVTPSFLCVALRTTEKRPLPREARSLSSASYSQALVGCTQVSICLPVRCIPSQLILHDVELRDALMRDLRKVSRWRGGSIRACSRGRASAVQPASPRVAGATDSPWWPAACWHSFPLHLPLLLGGARERRELTSASLLIRSFTAGSIVTLLRSTAIRPALAGGGGGGGGGVRRGGGGGGSGGGVSYKHPRRPRRRGG